jgi:hypothetical protein
MLPNANDVIWIGWDAATLAVTPRRLSAIPTSPPKSPRRWCGEARRYMPVCSSVTGPKLTGVLEALDIVDAWPATPYQGAISAYGVWELSDPMIPR